MRGVVDWLHAGEALRNLITRACWWWELGDNNRGEIFIKFSNKKDPQSGREYRDGEVEPHIESR